MTISQAQDELKKINNQWFDFDYWLCLQLHARGFGGKEYTKRFALAKQLHKKREAELKAFNENLNYEELKMEQAGATCEESNAFFRSHDKELDELVEAWRSLD
jgi:hypothetical protein